LCLIGGLTVITIIWHPLRCIISIGGGGGWGWGLHSRRWRSFNIDNVIHAHLLLFIGVTEDDDFAVIGQPKELTVEVTKESFDEFLIPWGVGDEIFLIQRKIHHRDPLRRPTLLKDRWVHAAGRDL
jgi:hypothetical protein